jgi:hypothetical protein
MQKQPPRLFYLVLCTLYLCTVKRDPASNPSFSIAMKIEGACQVTWVLAPPSLQEVKLGAFNARPNSYPNLKSSVCFETNTGLFFNSRIP